MNRLIIAFIITLIVGLFGYFVLADLTQLTDVAYRVVFGTTLAMGTTALITAWFLFASLKDLKASGRKAYIIIAVGILLYALALLSQPAVALLAVYVPAINATAVEASFSFIIPFLLGTFALYIGTRKLAVVLDIKTIWMSPILAVGVSAALAAGSLLLPHTPFEDAASESLRTVVLVAATLGGCLALFGSAIAVLLKQAMNSTYRNAMNWLSVALAGLGIAVLQEVIFKGTDLIDGLYVSNSLNLVPFLISGLLFLKAGHALQAATQIRLASSATFLDAIIYASQQVSNSAAIDPILEDLRLVTSGMQEGTKLTDEKLATIMGVYLKIEAYLESKEPIRNITAAGLRARMTPEFLTALEKYQAKH